MKRVNIFLLCMLLLIGCIPLPVAAADYDAVPCYNNAVTVNSGFTISDSGMATVNITYNGVANLTTGATITTKIQKRTLGLIWTNVDIGTEDNVWVDETTDFVYATSHSVNLKSKGTYRAVVDFVIRGTGGAADEITQTSTSEY